MQGGQLHGVADGAMRHAGDRVGQLQWPAELEQIVKFGVCRISLAGLLLANLVTWQQPDAFYWPVPDNVFLVTQGGSSENNLPRSMVL
uniref:Uncharacterized protein n=1 Tax=Plasmid NR79 TaxID=2468 RepID=O70049_9ZZZZ|nr:unknown [Plasmid NR79]